MDLGWPSLAPADPVTALSGYVLGLGTRMALASLFGGLARHLPRRRKRKRGRK